MSLSLPDWPTNDAVPLGLRIEAVPCPQESAAVWRIDLDTDFDEACWALLDAREQARASRLVFARDRHRFVAAHAGLRLILAQGNQAMARQLEFCIDQRGKPSLSSGPQFSLSHAQGLAVCALCTKADGGVGIDLEPIRPVDQADQIVKRWFNAEEFHAYQQGCEDDPVAAFARCWTFKEAWLKALGLGLDCLPEAPPFDAQAWSRQQLDLGPAWACALVVKRETGFSRGTT